jgi:hypothetical protein
MAGLRQRWETLWFEPAPPLNLGLCRIFFFGALFLFYLPQDFSVWSTVSDVFWQPVSLFRWLHLKVLSEETLGIVQLLWKSALALSCVGFFTSVSVGTSFFLGIYLLGLPHNFGKVHHADAILVFAFGILAFSRCGDSCSLDRLIRTRRFRTAPPETSEPVSGEYTWPIRTIWLAMTLVFFAAGWSKIRQSGLAWISSDQLRILLLQHNYYLSDSDPLTSWGLILAQYPRLCHLLAAATILCETTYPLALISVTARWILAPAGFLMLVAIRVLMGPGFEALMICHVFWIPWERVYARFRAPQEMQGP